MRKIGCLMALMMIAITAMAQRGQDFASHFMQKCEGDTALQCVTVSPKMMEQLTKEADASHEEHMADAIEKLKSVRIVTASVHGEGYYKMAENLLKRNSQRFHYDKSYSVEFSYGAFYSRKLKSGETVELVMLHVDTNTQRMVIVNLTGDIDDEFISSLTKMFSGRTSKAW